MMRCCLRANASAMLLLSTTMFSCGGGLAQPADAGYAEDGGQRDGVSSAGDTVPLTADGSAATCGAGMCPSGQRCCEQCGEPYCYSGNGSCPASAQPCPLIPACAADTKQGSVCASGAKTCAQSDGSKCTCEPICSGAQPVDPPPTTWRCSQRDPNCPVAAPMDGSSCAAPEKLQCNYGSCGGQQAVCQNGRWKVTIIPPPP